MADVPNCPRGREEQYLARAAGLDNDAPENPWSREEAYLAAIGNRIGDAEEDISELDQKVAALATDISLKGSVESYDDLPEDAAVGDAYITEDTGILYVWVGDKWTPLNMEGGSATVFYFDMGQGSAGFVKNTTVPLYKDFELTELATGPDVFAAVEAGTALLIAELVDVVDEEVYGRYRWATYIPHFVADDGMDGQGDGAFLAISDTSKTAEWAWVSNTWRVMNVYDAPTVVQNTGTSQTDVMSQNAVTSMVYADPATREIVAMTTAGGTKGVNSISIGRSAHAGSTDAIAIGNNSNAGAYGYSVALGTNSGVSASNGIAIGNSCYAQANRGIAIGTGSRASYTGSIGLGAGAQPSANGELAIGTDNTSYGYNSTNYRLITGVHDPQAAHDAATKGYVDTHLGGLSFVALTQNEYDALANKDPNTLYIIKAA